ncbi:MAG TPA: hypothetical protein VF472_25400 [Burkholderiaceae bacterium]
MDEAFLPFSALIAGAQALPGDLVDESAGVRSHVTQCRVEMPIELDVTRDGDGRLQIGSVPPLYRTETSFLPSFHRITVTICLEGEAHAD